MREIRVTKTVTMAAATAGHAEGGTTLNAFDNALLAAGIGNINLIKVSSILPPEVPVIELPKIKPGALVPTAYAAMTSETPGETVAAAVGYAVPDDPADGSTDATAEPDGDGLAVVWLHAAKSSASTARRTANRPVPTLMTRTSLCDGRSMSWCSPARSSCAYRGFDRGRPDGPIDLTLDEIPGAIAANERPAEFDRDAVGVERSAFDEQRRRTATLVEKAGLSSPEEDGLEGLARANDLGVVAR